MKNTVLVNNQKTEKLNVFKTIYMVLFLFVLMGRFVSLYWVIPHFFDTLAFAGFLFFSGIFVVIDLLSEKKIFKAQDIIFLALFFASCTISCLIRINYGWSDNLKSLMSIALSLFFLYPCSVVMNKDKFEDIVVLIQKITVISWMVFSLISIYTFVIQYSNIFYIHGTRILLGCIENRLFGIFSDPNYASVVSIISMIFSVAILNYKNQGSFIRIISIINIITQFIYIVLGASRTGEVCLLVVIFISGFVYSYKFNNNKKIIALIVRILVLACTCLAVHFLIEYTRIILSYIPSLVGISCSGNSSLSIGLYQISMERPDVAENSDISNLRFRIWGSAMDIFKTTWLFGASPRNALKYAKDVIPDAFIVQRGYDAHNFYVATLFYTGVMGAVFLGIFLIKNALSIIRYYLAKNFCVNDSLFNSAVISVICIAVSGMFLSEILFITTVGSFLFWMFMGYIVNTIKERINLM